MNKKKLLSFIGLVLSSGMAQGTLAQPQKDAGSTEAAQIVQELIESGYLKIDENSRRIVLSKPVLEILKESGLAKELTHSEMAAAGCGSTIGDGCSSPF